jgi:hypothetical protein
MVVVDEVCPIWRYALVKGVVGRALVILSPPTMLPLINVNLRMPLVDGSPASGLGVGEKGTVI